MENCEEPRGEASSLTTCCAHRECGTSEYKLLICRRWYTLIFMTTDPLQDAYGVVLRGFDALFPRKDVRPWAMQEEDPVGTKSGFYVSMITLWFRDGAAFTPEHLPRLETFCTLEGQPKPIGFRHSCCMEKKREIDGCIRCWLTKDTFGLGHGLAQEGSRSAEQELRLVEDELQELAECISTSIGTTCGDGIQYGLVCDTVESLVFGPSR